jgi:hypothetical protein
VQPLLNIDGVIVGARQVGNQRSHCVTEGFTVD